MVQEPGMGFFSFFPKHCRTRHGFLRGARSFPQVLKGPKMAEAIANTILGFRVVVTVQYALKTLFKVFTKAPHII